MSAAKELKYKNLSVEAREIVDGVKKSNKSFAEYVDVVKALYSEFSQWEYASQKSADLRLLVESIPHGADASVNKSLTAFYIAAKALREAKEFFEKASLDEIAKALSK